MRGLMGKRVIGRIYQRYKAGAHPRARSLASSQHFFIRGKRGMPKWAGDMPPP